MRHIFIDKYLGGVRSALALTLIFGLEVWRCVLVWGFLFGWWKLGEGVVVYVGAVVYGVEDQQCDGVVQSELLCVGRQGGCGCEGEGAFDV